MTIQCLNTSCGKQNPDNTHTCQFCMQNLDLQRFHWARHAQDGRLSIRFDASILPGLLKRGLVIEPGTNGLLVDRGAVKGILAPGEYLLSTLTGEIRNWLATGITQEASIWLVDITPLDLDFHAGGRFTRDPLPIGASLKLRLEVDRPGIFLVNVLKGSKAFTLDDLSALLYPEVTARLDEWLKKYSLQELLGDAGKMQELEMKVESALQALFSQSGLKLLQVRTVELNLEPYEEVRGVMARAKMLVYQAQAEDGLAKTQSEIDQYRRQATLDAQKRLDEIKHNVDLQALVAKTNEVSVQEQQAVLFARMRKALLDDHMDEQQRAAEWARFLDNLDTQKLLQQKQRQDLLQAWDEQRIDHVRGRAHLLARLDVEEKYALKTIELRLSGTLEKEQIATTLENERARLEAYITLEEQKQVFDLRRRQSEADFEQRKRDEELGFKTKMRDAERNEDRADIAMGLEALHTMQLNRLAIEKQRMGMRWDDERIKLDLDIARQRQTIDLDLKKQQAAHQMAMEQATLANKHKLDLIGAVQSQGDLGLLLAADPDQAKAMQSLIEARIKAGRTPDQILAEAAERNPDVLREYREMIKGNAQQTQAQHDAASQMALDLLQKQLALQMEREREHSRQQQDMYQTGMQTAAQIARDVAQATSQNRTPPTIIVTSGQTASNPAEPLPAEAPEKRRCPQCGILVDAEHAFCPKCGCAFPRARGG